MPNWPADVAVGSLCQSEAGDTAARTVGTVETPGNVEFLPIKADSCSAIWFTWFSWNKAELVPFALAGKFSAG